MTPDPRGYPHHSISVKLEIFCKVKRDYSHWSYKKANEIKRPKKSSKKSNVQLFKEFMGE